VNVPIAGGVVANPGDIVVADEDGFVAVPRELAEDVILCVSELTAKHEEARVILRREEVTPIGASHETLLLKVINRSYNRRISRLGRRSNLGVKS